jgi:CO dehydrogenase maturation factor
MSYSIALAGKGGTGKTTVAGMLVKYLVQKGRTPVLAVDADANANLNEVLGLTVRETLGEAREEMKKGVAAGMTKDVFMQMKIQEAVVEAEGFDLIVMGRPEGAGCYCAANSLLTQFLDKLMDNYASIVIDNEAGMEHLSRMTTNNMDALLIISDPTKRGLQAASRILELTHELKLNINRHFLLVNQAKDSQEGAIQSSIKGFNMDLSGIIPDDPKVRELDLQGVPTIRLDEGSAALRAAYAAFDKIMAS